jgi:hypothetical protein
MKTAYIGWEAGNLQNSEVQCLTEVSGSMLLHGYEISLSMMHGDAPAFGQSNIAVVLFQAALVATKPNGWAGGSTVGVIELRQVGGTNKTEIHGNPALDSIFAASSFRVRPPGAANQILRCPVDLNWSVPDGYWLALQAGHSGLPVDFECQAVLFYD